MPMQLLRPGAEPADERLAAVGEGDRDEAARDGVEPHGEGADPDAGDGVDLPRRVLDVEDERDDVARADEVAREEAAIARNVGALGVGSRLRLMALLASCTR